MLSSYIHLCRNVVEHICLLKTREDIFEADENNMLDYLYTTQYQMSGIIAISLGGFSTPLFSTLGFTFGYMYILSNYYS